MFFSITFSLSLSPYIYIYLSLYLYISISVSILYPRLYNTTCLMNEQENRASRLSQLPRKSRSATIYNMTYNAIPGPTTTDEDATPPVTSFDFRHCCPRSGPVDGRVFPVREVYTPTTIFFFFFLIACP